MSNVPAEPSQDEVVRQIYVYTAEQLEAGVSSATVVEQLIERGLSREDAALVVRQTREAQSDGNRAAGRKNMVVGALWCLGGLAVTYFSYQSAASGGGRYVVTWGAVVFGAVQFFRGLAQSMSR